MELPETVAARRIAAFRAARKMSLRAVGARLVEIGYPHLDAAAVLKIEKSKRRITLNEAVGIAKVLGMTGDDLISPEGGPALQQMREKAAREAVERLR